MNPWLCNLLFNNSGGSSLPATGQTFYASLKTSLVPEVGTGGPTWSRATAAWRFNDLGLLRQIPSGCAEFGAARLVVNLAPRSEVINAGWTLSGVTASDANTLLESAGGTVHQIATTVVTLGTYLLEVWIKRGAGATRHVRLEVSSSDLARVNFNLDTGEVASIAQTGTLSLINYGADASVDAGGYRRFYIRVNASASASNTFYPARLTESLNGPISYSGDGTSSILINKVKISDVTGRDASYVPEYVSVGSDTNKNFFTHTDDFSQSAWSKTNVTITQAAIANPINGLVNAQKVEASSSATTSLSYISSTVGRVEGNIFVVYVKQGSGVSDANSFLIRNYTSSTNLVSITLNYSTGNITYVTGSTGASAVNVGGGWWRVTLVVTSGISANDQLRPYIGFVGGSETINEFCYVYRPYLGCGITAPDIIPVVSAAWDAHGSGADGCKYFTTDSQGAPIPVANLTRLRKESSATNSLLWSRDLAGQTWTESGGNFTSSAWITSVTGSNLVTNGDFASGLSGWNDNGASTNTWSGGRANLDGTGGLGGIYQVLTTTVGKTYLITASMTVISGSGNAIISIKGSTVGSTTIKYDGAAVSKNISIIFKAALTNHVLYIYTSSGRISQFDDIVVKECTCYPERTVAGLDGIANTATTLTATSTDAIILQPTSGIASAARCASAYVKRRTGTGTISFTQDGGSTWTDITSQINSSTWSRVQITSTLANPSVGFKISMSGDAIDVDCVQNEAGSVATSPIVTTTATVTRNADSLTYQTSGNIDFAAGTAYIGLILASSVYGGYSLACTSNGRIVYSYLNDTRIASYDGVNVVYDTPPAYTSGRPIKVASAWGGVTKSIGVDGRAPVAGDFDGSMGSGANIDVGGGVSPGPAYIGPVAIYNYKMTDAELQAITT